MIIKRILLLAFITTGISNTYAQAPVEIKGVLSSNKNKQIRLFQTNGGTASEIAQIRVKEDGAFRFSFFPEYEGLYLLGTATASAPDSNMTFYLKEGDRLELALTDNSYELQGKNNSKENQILSKWNELSGEVRQKSSGLKAGTAGPAPADFFPDVERLNTEAKSFARLNKSNNRRFDQFLPKVIKWDMGHLIGSYMSKPGVSVASAGNYSTVVKGMKAADYTRSAYEAYKFPQGYNTIGLMVRMELMKSATTMPDGITGLEKRLQLIQNDTLKGDEILNYLSMQSSYRPFTEAANKYNSYFLTDRQKQLFGAVKLKFSEFTPGDLGFEFAYPDKNDKTVRLSDFKGKVVVIDVWATWCGPCIKEIPYLEKLGEEYKGKNVVFVSLSTDDVKDKAKWLKMIEEEGMKGVQLLAGKGNEFSKFYKIATIPRFLVFDKKGNLVSANAPRPSDPKLKSVIEEELRN